MQLRAVSAAPDKLQKPRGAAPWLLPNLNTTVGVIDELTAPLERDQRSVIGLAAPLLR